MHLNHHHQLIRQCHRLQLLLHPVALRPLQPFIKTSASFELAFLLKEQRYHLAIIQSFKLNGQDSYSDSIPDHPRLHLNPLRI